MPNKEVCQNSPEMSRVIRNHAPGQQVQPRRHSVAVRIQYGGKLPDMGEAANRTEHEMLGANPSKSGPNTPKDDSRQTIETPHYR